jgi:hypothetical protein
LHLDGQRRAAGICRDTSLNWRNRGTAYLANPEECPENARYGLFVQRIEEAELRCKATVIGKLLQSDDWRGWRFWLVNRTDGEWKSEHIKSEISGPDGAPLALGNPFQFSIHLSGPEIKDSDFKIIDHTHDDLPDDPATAEQRRILSEESVRQSLHEAAQRKRVAERLVAQNDPLSARMRPKNDYSPTNAISAVGKDHRCLSRRESPGIKSCTGLAGDSQNIGIWPLSGFMRSLGIPLGNRFYPVTNISYLTALKCCSRGASNKHREQ